ncbi:probable cytochrome P450 6a14 [Uranotaenia lowii]|uniref:probable cytochrome P450 6a14 n=1 Tax=Uranotaenia lowii TaxID=190385 RepID=UPI002479DC2B|nr:probable cytochrome P450 6a14 [Uranotaenia lowii]
MSLLGFLLASGAIALTALLIYLRNRQQFWAKRNFPCAPNPHLIYGHSKGQITEKHAVDINRKLYREFRDRGLSFGGVNFFMVPAVLIVDPEMVKTVLVRDFHVFHDRGIYSDPVADPLSGHLFLLEGQAWRTLRQKLTPTFTSGRMKSMFGTIVDVANELTSFMENTYQAKPEMEMKDVLVRFTTDVIGTCAFGIRCNTLNNPDSEFLKNGEKVFEMKMTNMVKFVFASLYKDLARSIGVKLNDVEVERFFMGLVKDTVSFRETNNVQRNDFLNLLIQLKNKGYLADHAEQSDKEPVKLTLNEVAAQCFVFFIAGFETSSTTMNFCLYELAMNPDIQERLRSEINEAIQSNGGNINYDLVMGIQYLDNVINETLRKYPPLESLNRVTNQDYRIPNTNHVIPNQTMITIPVHAIQHDPNHYPDPERFDPDRFLPENVKSRHPYVFIPFGEGPRICIGLRFGMMQAKMGLITLLRGFKFSPSPMTPPSIVFDKKAFVLSPQGGNHLRVDKI